MQPNPYHSYQLGPLPKGCQYCVRGEKLVLLITGLCPRKCYFCPLSDKKYQQDVIYANEYEITNQKNLIPEILEEVDRMKAKGAGITGGDPLLRLDRTIECIKVLKKNYGRHFHVHLYTSLDLANEENLRILNQSGLDEIRFHLDLNTKQLWEKLILARKFKWDIGVEIPLIPNKEKETRDLIDFVSDKVNFLNLNELEIADNQHSQLLHLGYTPKDLLSYAVTGSLELGLKILDYIQQRNYPFSVHLCTAKLKDAVQLANRIKREAKYSRHHFDQMDSEGLLTRGALYLPELAPGFRYRETLERADRKEAMAKLNQLLKLIIKQTKLKEKDLFLDERKLRFLLSVKNTAKNKDKFLAMGLKPAVVKEYPTADQLEVELEFL